MECKNRNEMVPFMWAEEQHVPYNVLSLSDEAHKVCPRHVHSALLFCGD